MKAIIAVAQIDSGADIQQNISKMCAMTKEAKQNGADLILFPEHADDLGTGMRKRAQGLDGKLIETMAKCAAEHEIYLHLGSFAQKSDCDKPYNTSVLFDRRGNVIASYQKTHLFEVDMKGKTSVKESDTVSAGNEIVVVDTDFARIGMAICYDLRFPQLFYKMAKQGAQIICLPANFTYDTGKAHWEILLRARAIETTCYIAAADQIGQKPEFRAYGHSMIIDPWGDKLAEATDEESIIYAEYDTDRMREIRSSMPSLDNAREDL
ncbi:carbon-nitrogen hydrolase family protein [Eubacterium oxidoreducens]|uniref:Predicted amidohydrolase n=1 Tax=Eubacterium oxidoreducens TaxID=1732 RepID=A0A1G6BN24_EUBOX|nr:carbon-nitrogen hydrolase family protein [Eubacterium oxidoreducens]SDB22050.1 Predicted amidohydrolase [Eubacterium oxidoreducens]